jgi:tetratricopeptide (TPR) repeat protein
LPLEVQVVGILPHAHYLGKELVGSATGADGVVQPLILIKNWDFNWQSDYRYKEPLTLAKGTKVSMRYVFDNSESNVHNPNHPPKAVRYGPNSTDEMAELWLEVVPKTQDDLGTLLDDYAVNYALPDALARCRGVLKYSPENADFRAKLGLALAKSGKFDEGIAELRKAIEQDPKNAKAHYMLGLTLMKIGPVSEAIEEYEKVLKLDPDSYAAHNNLGLIYLRQSKFDRAAPHLYNAVRINPNDVLANMNLAKLFLLQKQWGQARLQLKTILEIEPENRFARETLPTVQEAMEKQQ